MSAVHRIYNVLFICTGNSARSIMAECILNRLGQGRFKAYSAGSHPTGHVNPNALALLQRLNFPIETLRSKSWAEFAAPSPIDLDFVFTSVIMPRVRSALSGRDNRCRRIGASRSRGGERLRSRDRRGVQRDLPHAEQPHFDLCQSADRLARRIEPATTARRDRPDPGCAGAHRRGLTDHRRQAPQ